MGSLERVGLLIGPALSLVDAQVVNLALPAIASGLGSSLLASQWVVSAYLLSLGVGLAGTGYLARRLGARQIYLASLLSFTVASVLCASASSVPGLVAFRVLQGAMGAPLIPLAMTMLMGGKEVRSGQSPLPGVLLFLAPAVGPALGGILISSFGWPSVFWINVPLGIVGFLALRRRVPAIAKPSEPGPFDLPGFLMLSAGLVALTLGAAHAPLWGWASSRSWPWLVAGTLLLVDYTIWAMAKKGPVLEIWFLKDPQVALSFVLSALASLVMFSVLFLIPSFMERVQGVSALVAGLTLLPQGLAIGIGTFLGENLLKTNETRRVAFFGMASMAATGALLLWIGPTTPSWLIAFLLSLRGLATGLAVQPLFRLSLSGHDLNAVSDANTLYNVVERLSGSIGIAALATFSAVREGARIGQALKGAVPGIPIAPKVIDRALTLAFQDTVAVMFVLVGLGFLLSLLLPASSARGADRNV